MRRFFFHGILIWSFTIIKAKEPELPLCPTNMQYFPQNLPMHCRMPVGAPPRISRSPSDKPPQPIQIPMNGFLGNVPGAVPGGGYPGTLGGGMPVPMPGAFPGISGGVPGPLSGGMPMPMPMPLPQSPAHKLPVIVMPFYSQDTSDKVPQIPQRQKHKKHRKNYTKKRPKQYYSDEDSTDTDTSEDDNSDSSSNVGWWKNLRHGRRSNRHKSNRRKHKKQELLTPVLQYVTKDGYVIYEKQISKGEAKGWLGNKNGNGNEEDTARRHQQELESHEPKDDVETGFLVKEEEPVETTTENKPQVIYKNKNLKRKVSKKHT